MLKMSVIVHLHFPSTKGTEKYMQVYFALSVGKCKSRIAKCRLLVTSIYHYFYLRPD
jgi:hypothetical protein